MACTVSPFDMVRTRLMNQPPNAKIYSGFADCFVKVKKKTKRKSHYFMPLFWGIEMFAARSYVCMVFNAHTNIFYIWFTDYQEGRSEGTVRRIHPHLVPLCPYYLSAACDFRAAQTHLRCYRQRRIKNKLKTRYFVVLPFVFKTRKIVLTKFSGQGFLYGCWWAVFYFTLYTRLVAVLNIM